MMSTTDRRPDKASYGVSALNSSSTSSAKAKGGKVDFRARHEDIVIPVVTLAAGANDSPRSVGTEHSVLTANSGYKIAPGRASRVEGVASGRTPASLKLPVQILRGKGGGAELVVEVSAHSVSSNHNDSSQLSKLEQGLPPEMQGYRKRVAAELLYKLRESLSLSASVAKIRRQALDQDDSSIGSEPEHFSSGASLKKIPNLRDQQRTLGISNGSLWAQPDSADSIEHREVVLERKRRGEHVDALPSSSQSAFFDQGSDDDASLRLAIQAGEYLARHSGSDYGLHDLEQNSFLSNSVGDPNYTASQSILSLGDVQGLEPQQSDGEGHHQQHEEGSLRDLRDGDSPSSELISAFLAVTDVSFDHVDFNLTSLTRQKLQQLGKYVLGHTLRKVLVAWNLIDARFQKSSQMKTEMVFDPQTGLSTPQKHAALPLSTLVAMLCSPQVRVVHSELPGLCKKLDCTVDDVARARRIAAIRLILGPDQGKNLKQKDVLLAELNELNDGPTEKLVSGLQFKAVVFPSDAQERDKMLKTIDEERSLWIRQQVEERKKRDDLKERVETRRRKLIQDYDDAMATIQFPKGPLAPHRLQALKELIEYCEASYTRANLTQDVTVSEENVSLLGRDAFPRFVQDSPTMSGEANNTAAGKGPKLAKSDLVAKLSEEAARVHKVNALLRRVGYEGQFRIMLQGRAEPGKNTKTPRVLALIKEVVTYGKGLNGMAYRDVVESLQAYAVTRLASRFRCMKRSWRYKAAREKWRAKFLDIKVRFIRAWYHYVKHVFDTKTFCFRAVVSWHFYTRRAILRRDHFKIAFWPFYVWHRWAAARRTATEKSQFLVFRVLPSYILLRNYRAWKRYYLKEKHDRDEADAHVARWTSRRARVLLRWYRRWTLRRKRLRSAWHRSGINTHRSKMQLCKITPFLIWKAYWWFKRQVHARVKAHSFQFRSALLPDHAPLRPLTCKERRDVCLAAREAKEKAADAEATEANEGEEDVQSLEETSRDTTESKGKKNPKKGRGETGVPEEMEAEVEVARPRTKAIFYWKLRPVIYDVPSDGEDEVRCARINNCYAEMVPLAQANDLDFLVKADEFIMRKVGVLARRFQGVDKLALIETSVRYQRYMYRAFLHLRTNARVRCNARTRAKKLNNKLKLRSFLGLVTWMMRDANGGVNFADQTPAEECFYAAKDHRMDKMMKWRDMAQVLKTVYSGQNTSAEATTGKRGSKFKKKEEENATLLNPDGTPFVPPNFLEWDRADRQIETEQAERMVIVSREVRLKVIAITETAQVESEIFNANEVMLNRTVNEVLETEDNITQAAIEAEMLYISAFKRHAADNLLTVLVRIRREVDLLLMKKETKKYFRMLRMPMLEKRGESLYNYKKMANWMRICKRLISISQNAPQYHRSRTLWVFYNRWLKLVEKESLDATPGLILQLTRRKVLFPRFSRLLHQAGFKRLPYAGKRLYSACSTTRAIFYRWLQETQEDKNFRLLEQRAADLFKYRLLQRCFSCLRTAMSPQDTWEQRQLTKPYMLVRVEADLGHLSKRFVAPRKRSLPYCIASFNRRTVCYQKRDARRMPSMKSFIEGYRMQVGRRLVREQRILLDAFEARGTQQFLDVPTPDGRDLAIMPGLMARVDGKRFFDPQPERTADEVAAAEAAAAEEEGEENNMMNNDLEELLPPLPGGFKMHKLRVNHSVDMGQPGAIQGIVGWQLVWCADGCKDIEGPKRGRWKGASMRVYELVLAKEDFVVGVEYAYEGVSILGLRLRQYFAGWSRWLGDRPGVSTLTLYLGPETSPLAPFERDYISPGRDEEEAPAMPRAFIIGLSGVETQGRLTGLTLVVRKVKDQHIFSYVWVGDALAVQEAKEAAILAEKVRGHFAHTATLKAAKGMSGEMSNTEAVSAAHTHAASKDFHRSDHSGVHLPAIGGSTIGKEQQRDDDSVGSRSVGDLSSISHASRAPDGSGAQADDASTGGGSVRSFADKARTLTSPEEQFFDVFRMRLMEIKTAEDRAEKFARKLWSARQIRDHPVLQKLATITIIAPLTRWYFASICKRVVKALPTEDLGETMLEESKKDSREADRLFRRSINESIKAQDFEAQPRSWTRVQILSPSERALKKAYLEELRALKQQAASTKHKSMLLAEESARKAKEGRNLLPRMCLSTYICNLYATKLAAARHKETLLQSMDLDAIKRALLGGDARLSELTDIAMEMIRYSLANQKPPHSDPLALEKLVDAEVRRARVNLEATGTRLMGLSSPRSTGALLSLVAGGSSGGLWGRCRGDADSSPHIVLPIVSATQNDAAEAVPGYMTTSGRTAQKFRKLSGISNPQQLSKTSSAVAFQKVFLSHRKVGKPSPE